MSATFRLKHVLFAGFCSGLVLTNGCSKEPAATVSPPGLAFSKPVGIHFTDVTKAAGVDFRHVHGGSGRRYYIETMSAGCAFLDFDGDGWLDILLLQGAPLPGYDSSERLTPVLYRNNRDGTFSDVTSGSGLDEQFYAISVAVGDYDNDGLPDLYITALGGNRLFHNEGGGRFRDVTAQAGVAGKDLSTGAAWVDFDHDGLLDLFVCRYMDYSVESDPLCRDALGRPAYCSPHVYEPTHSLLYRNNGDGTFSDVTASSGIGSVAGRSFGAICADFNDDGWIDIYVANDLTPNFLFLNNGDGTFREHGAFAGVAYGEHGIARAGMGVDCGDYDNDGRMDLFVTNFENEPNSLFRNEGAGWFVEQSYQSRITQFTLPYVGWGCRFVDLDLDGFQDLFVANGHVNDYADENSSGPGYAQPCLVLHNQGNGTFADISHLAGSFFSRRLVARGVAFGDYDNDGRMDVLIACNNSSPVLLRNTTANAGNWIRLLLIGNQCNRDALGASVRARTASVTQIQYVRSGGSCLADHDRRLLFGLGEADRVAVEIRWPCGALQQLDLRAGQSEIVEEKGCHLAIQ
jgi:enediyne biosynthesis protein E4